MGLASISPHKHTLLSLIPIPPILSATYGLLGTPRHSSGAAMDKDL
jgi:hypothetical protein